PWPRVVLRDGVPARRAGPWRCEATEGKAGSCVPYPKSERRVKFPDPGLLQLREQLHLHDCRCYRGRGATRNPAGLGDGVDPEWRAKRPFLFSRDTVSSAKPFYAKAPPRPA